MLKNRRNSCSLMLRGVILTEWLILSFSQGGNPSWEILSLKMSGCDHKLMTRILVSLCALRSNPGLRWHSTVEGHAYMPMYGHL